MFDFFSPEDLSLILELTLKIMLKTNVVPFPFWLCTSIVPLCFSMIPYVTANPKPMPLAFVVKNGSKSLLRFSVLRED